MHLNKLNIETKRIIFFSIITCVILVLGVISKTYYHSLVATTQKVEKNQELLLKSEQALSIAQDILTDTRRFMIIPHQQVTMDVSRNKNLILSIINRLQQLTTENPRQTKILDGLKKQVENQVNLSLIIIKEIEKGELNETKKIAFLSQGEILVNKIKDQIEAFQMAENQSLTQWNLAKAQSSATMNRVFTLLIGSVILFLFGSFILFKNHNLQRKNTEKNIQHLNKELAIQVADKTKEIINTEKRYRFILENMQEGILIIGFDWRFLYANHAVKKRWDFGNELTGFNQGKSYLKLVEK